MGIATSAQAQATIIVDTPQNNATVTQPFGIGGWAVDTHVATGTGVDAVHIWACLINCSVSTAIPLGAATYGGSRPDVGAALGDSRFTPSGYGLTVSGLAPGAYQIVVYAFTTGNPTPTASVFFIAVNANPAMWVDTPTHNANVTQPLSIQGWAIDRAAPINNGTGVDALQVWAYPNPGSGAAAVYWGAPT